jgi:putative transposase
VKVAASTVWEILRDAGIPPAPERASSTWAYVLRSQRDALLACDFFETVTLSGARFYVFAVIEHASRRIQILGATPHPTSPWVTQMAKNLAMDLEDVCSQARFLIRDRDGVLSGVRVPRMNAIMERWVETCRRELLDRTLIWNDRQLLHALREFEQFSNEHRPHQGIANARPLHGRAGLRQGARPGRVFWMRPAGRAAVRAWPCPARVPCPGLSATQDCGC